MTLASPPSMIATHEFVVPRSIPIVLPIELASLACGSIWKRFFGGQIRHRVCKIGSRKECVMSFPAQKQDRQPGLESQMKPRPRAVDKEYRGSGKLEDKVALITGGDS